MRLPPLFLLGLACTAHVWNILVTIILEDNNDDCNNHVLNKTKFWHLLHMSKMIKTFSVIGMRLSTSLA